MTLNEGESVFSDVLKEALLPENRDLFTEDELRELKIVQSRLKKLLYLSVRQIEFLEEVQQRLRNNTGDK